MTIQNLKSHRWSKSVAHTPRASGSPTGNGELDEGIQPHPGRRMTEKEFLNWVGEKTRAEWVDGEVILMSPVNVEHDDLQGWLNAILRLFVEGRDLGRVCGSELAVRFEKQGARRLTDTFFVAKERLGNFEKTSYNGAPDFIIEIVSPDSTTRDYRDKFRMYEAAGVKEYWIIDPLSRNLVANDLFKGKYRPIPEKQGSLNSKVLKGFWLRPSWLWEVRLPKVADILRQMDKK